MVSPGTDEVPNVIRGETPHFPDLYTPQVSAACVAIQRVEFDLQLCRCFGRREQFDHQGAPLPDIFSVFIACANLYNSLCIPE